MIDSYPMEPECPEPIGYCIECDGDIFAGDDIWEINGDWYCEDCISKCHTEAERRECFYDVI